MVFHVFATRERGSESTPLHSIHTDLTEITIIPQKALSLILRCLPPFACERLEWSYSLPYLIMDYTFYQDPDTELAKQINR